MQSPLKATVTAAQGAPLVTRRLPTAVGVAPAAPLAAVVLPLGATARAAHGALLALRPRAALFVRAMLPLRRWRGMSGGRRTARCP